MFLLYINRNMTIIAENMDFIVVVDAFPEYKKVNFVCFVKHSVQPLFQVEFVLQL